MEGQEEIRQMQQEIAGIKRQMEQHYARLQQLETRLGHLTGG